MKSAKGKVVVITGASAGVGRALTRRFAADGARLALIAREATALEEARAEAEFKGATTIALPLDVADDGAVFAAAEDIEARLGPIDIWINNAMATVFSPVTEINPEEFRRVTDVTYHGYVHGTMAALRHMRARNRGTIVQVGSALAYRGIPLQAAYCGAKHAARGFTDSLRTELLHEKSAIQLTMVHLPAVNTPQFDWARTHMDREPRPVPPVAPPEAIADSIYRAALNPHREVWVGASTLKVILGNFVAPWYLDRFLARNAFEAQGRKAKAGKRADNLFDPVAGLHRTEGPFDKEARASAVAVSGTAARTATIAAGAVLFAIAGGLLGRGIGRRSRPRGRDVTRRIGW
jgi:short-subunit dehydrogenase